MTLRALLEVTSDDTIVDICYAQEEPFDYKTVFYGTAQKAYEARWDKLKDFWRRSCECVFLYKDKPRDDGEEITVMALIVEKPGWYED